MNRKILSFSLAFAVLCFNSHAFAAPSPYCELASSYLSPRTDLLAIGCRARSSTETSATIECDDGEETANAMIAQDLQLPFFQSFMIGGVENSLEWSSKLKECLEEATFDGLNILQGANFTFGAIRRIPIYVGENSESWHFWISLNGQSSRRNQNDFLIYLFSTSAGTPDNVISNQYILNTKSTDDYENSDIMVAGTPINYTDSHHLEKSIVDRGWKKGISECHRYGGKQFGCLHSTTLFADSSNPIGIVEISLEQFASKVEQVNYYFDNLANYTDFIDALDTKYGKSTRKSKNDCTHRKWESGTVYIDGYYCAAQPKKFRIEVFDLRVYDERRISEYATAYLRKPIDTGAKTQRKNIPLDMF